MIRAGVLAAVLATAVAACSSPEAEPTPTVVALRTIPFNGNCRGVGTAAVLRGSHDDPEVAWLADLGNGPRRPVVWPQGDAAVFAPELRIVNASGRVVLRDGDYVDGGCVTGADADGPLLVPNPQDAFRLDCGPVRPIDCPSMVNAIRYATNDWPRAPIAAVTFTDAAGHYTITLEDGRRIDGLAPRI